MRYNWEKCSRNTEHQRHQTHGHHTQAHGVGLKFDRLHIPSCLWYIGHGHFLLFFFIDIYFVCFPLNSSSESSHSSSETNKTNKQKKTTHKMIYALDTSACYIHVEMILSFVQDKCGRIPKWRPEDQRGEKAVLDVRVSRDNGCPLS